MKRVGAIVLVIAAIALGGGWWIYGRLRGDGGPRLPTESDVDRLPSTGSLPVLVNLSAGTVVASGPLSGWSQPIIKTITFVESGDVDTLPAFARKTASRFRTVVLADVRRHPDPKRYTLRRVGVGLCLELNGVDTVISSSTLNEQNVELGTIDTLVLGRAERALGRSHLAAKTPTFALYDTFVELADSSGMHHSIIIRYAMIVDPSSGGLQTAYWTMAEKEAARTPPQTLTLMPPRSEFQCGIHVEARRLVGIPASWGFAMVKLPPGAPLAMPPSLSDQALRDTFDEDSASLEKAVRQALGDQVKTATK